MRFFLVVVAILVGVPLAAGVLLAVMFAGWTSVAVALIFWLALFAIGVVGVSLAVRNLRPVQDLASSAGRLADGDYSARVASTESRAMGPVVESFNQMAERLETSDDLRRRLLADVGHELRTPLTIIRGEIEAMTDGVRELSVEGLRPLLDDLDAMERLLDDLRTLSAVEAGMVKLDREATDVSELAADVVGRFAGRTAEQGVSLTASVDPGTSAHVDPGRVAQVLSNLIANALRATASGDRIEITGRQSDDGENAIIEVRDTGRGIEPERLDSVFDRFHKGADSSGSGLGLTISRDLVVAHGGSLHLSSRIGTGTTVVLSLPRAP